MGYSNKKGKAKGSSQVLTWLNHSSKEILYFRGALASCERRAEDVRWGGKESTLSSHETLEAQIKDLCLGYFLAFAVTTLSG